MDKRRCYILCAGPTRRSDSRPLPDDFVICCDGGFKTAQSWGIRPHLFIGDFDSYDGQPPDGIPSLRLLPEKDDTDSMAAIKEGLDMGFRDFLLVCALGGRLDHTVGNLQGLRFILEHGGQTAAAEGCGDRAFLIQNGRIDLEGRPGGYVSAFAVDGEAVGVSTEGLYYPLMDATLSCAFPLGVSNQFTCRNAAFSVRQGRLLVILPREEPPSG